MDSGTLNWEHKTAVLTNELTQGIEHTKQLRAYLGSVASSSDGTPELLLRKILSSYEQSLLIVKGSEVSAAQSPQPLPPPAAAIDRSPVEIFPRVDDMNSFNFDDQREPIHNSYNRVDDMNSFNFDDQLEPIHNSYNRRSLTWTNHVRVSPDSSIEDSIDDGHSWRKYGQKEIHNAKFPRSYYRCAYRVSQDCMATKQVHRENDDPTVFEITYKDGHTCQPFSTSKSALQPDKQANHIPTGKSSQGLFISTTNTSSQSFGSPTTSESSYWSGSFSLQHSDSCRTDVGAVLNLYHSESDRTNNILSTNTSTSTSSIMGDFSTRSLGATSKFPVEGAIGASGSGSTHQPQRSSSIKQCQFNGCFKGARGASGLCIAHGGGSRCQKPSCHKGAEGQTAFCKAHGGRRRCEFLGCTKGAVGPTDFCISHGVGRRCSHEGCTSAARGKCGLCIRHGGGKRCEKENCTKSAEGLSGLCIAHGGGPRC